MFTAVPIIPNSFVAKGYLQAQGNDIAALFTELIAAPLIGVTKLCDTEATH